MRFLLADDHALFRDSMAVWLRQLDENLTIDFASSYDEAHGSILSVCDYDIVMLDLDMPGMQGVVSVQQLCKLLDETPLLVVSADETPMIIRHCIKAGAAGYVPKSSNGDTILQAIRQVLDGKSYIPECATSQADDMALALNEKQLQLLALLAEGHSNRDIAGLMHLSEGTVKQYVSRILQQLGVDNRMQAAMKARKILGIGL